MALNEEDRLERVRAGRDAYWANITPEQRVERSRKSADTRARNQQLYAEMRKAAAEREAKRERRREQQRALRNGPSVPPIFRAVPGSGGIVYRWDSVPGKYLKRRLERFWPYVDQSEGPESCWPWHGAQRFESGYGQAHWRGQSIPSHRVAWTLSSGLDIPYDLVVDHLCCCTWCQNPDHLEPITRGENNRRRHHRSAEATRVRTSFDSPFEDRWYPFGRRLYDAAGHRLLDVDERLY